MRNAGIKDAQGHKRTLLVLYRCEKRKQSCLSRRANYQSPSIFLPLVLYRFLVYRILIPDLFYSPSSRCFMRTTEGFLSPADAYFFLPRVVFPRGDCNFNFDGFISRARSETSVLCVCTCLCVCRSHISHVWLALR